MSDPAAPAGAGPTAGEPLTAARIDAILADFRVWLTELAAAPDPGPAPPAVDLASVVAQVTALRHEVNLQTKASRAAVEQTAEALKLAAAPVPEADPTEAVRPLVKALVDIADALTVGLRQVEKERDGLDPLLADLAVPGTLESFTDEPVSRPKERPLLARLILGRRMTQEVRQNRASFRWAAEHYERRWKRGVEAVDTARRSLAGLADGYALSLKRVERALSATGLEAIDCVGEPFDPDRMEAVEAVDGGDDYPSGTVVEEVRRGYEWDGEPFRPAQVKVAR